jgi:cell division protein FtsZ
MFELLDTHSQNAVIKVIGVGGGGGNAVNHMLTGDIEGVDFICANTDAQALRNSEVRTLLQLGSDITKGLGAGANPEIGRQAAMEDRDRIEEVLAGADMVFITAGMGGGTGTGAAPVVAEVAKELGILTVAVVTKPFGFEGGKRMKIAEQGMAEMGKHVDSLITIPNEKLLAVLGKEMSLLNAFKSANDVLLHAVQGIAELITRPGLINVDFADVKTVMSEMGAAMMGSGESSGDNRAREAAERAIRSPLLEDVNLAGAKGILVNITAGLNLAIGEFDEVGSTVREFADEDATVVVGTVIDPDMQNDMRVTVVATGLGETARNGILQPAPVEELKTVQLVNSDIVEPQPDDYRELDRPTVLRNGASARQTGAAAAEGNMDYLDIPAFLRRQAD